MNNFRKREGREVCKRQENRLQEVELPKWWEVGDIMQFSCIIFCNQMKEQWADATKEGAGNGSGWPTKKTTHL